MNGDELLTVQEADARLKMSPEIVRRWLRCGKLQGYWLGGDRGGYRLAESDLEDFVAGWRTAGDDRVLEADS
jgi:excisionase family DNA binding protein